MTSTPVPLLTDFIATLPTTPAIPDLLAPAWVAVPVVPSNDFRQDGATLYHDDEDHRHLRRLEEAVHVGRLVAFQVRPARPQIGGSGSFWLRNQREHRAFDAMFRPEQLPLVRVRVMSTRARSRLVRVLMRTVQFARSCSWRIARPSSLGVRAILTAGGDKVVLVRHSYTDGWYLPGGKVKRGETVLDALWRELREEVGMPAGARPQPRLLGLYASHKEAKRDHIAVFVLDGALGAAAGGMEIADRRTFPLSALPDGLSRGTRRRLDEFRGVRRIEHLW